MQKIFLPQKMAYFQKILISEVYDHYWATSDAFLKAKMRFLAFFCCQGVPPVGIKISKIRKMLRKLFFFQELSTFGKSDLGI
jgi:hypothetical protein